MRDLVVINGERDWQGFFPGLTVHQRRLQECQWLLRDGHLWAMDASGTLRMEAVFWRLGAVKPQSAHRTVLEMIRLAGIPCVNSAETLLRGYDRLSMRAELAQAGLPVVPLTVALGDGAVAQAEQPFPAVVKVGNLHGGWGKARATSPEEWEDITSLAFAQESYVTVEPYLDYARDLRCLVVGDDSWGMARRGSGWKANVQTVSHELIELPAQLVTWTRALQKQVSADILAVDFLEHSDGSFVALEYNDAPGFTGFPSAARGMAARCVRERLGGGGHG